MAIQTGSLTANASGHDTAHTSYASISTSYPLSNAYTASNSTSYAQVNLTTGANAETYIYLTFNFSSIPENATIQSVTAKAKGYISSTNSNRINTRTMQLASGTTLKGGTLTMSTSQTEQTFSNTGSWTRAELQSAACCFYAKRGTSSTTSNYYIRIYGATMTVTYQYDDTTYTITVNNSSSAIVTAEPSVVRPGGSSSVIADTISGLTITDNGNNVTSLFVQQSGTTGSYEIETRGSYGFALNNNDYYESQNKGVDKSAAVCRVSFDLPVASTITITFINYAEATYDFGVFGNVDVELNTNYYAANSSVNETSYKLACNTSTYNKSSTQTLTYSNVAAGSHFIDIKFSKDDATASNNDTLQFKIAITYNQTVTTYIYDITNIQADHTIVVSAAASGPKIYLKVNGTWIQCSNVYVKTNGSWVQQSNITNVFNTTANYVKG